MTYRGRIKNGSVELDREVSLPDGTEVWVDLRTALSEVASTPEAKQTLGQKLLKYAGKAVDLPSDLSRNHDHYLYGTPKK